MDGHDLILSIDNVLLVEGLKYNLCNIFQLCDSKCNFFV